MLRAFSSKPELVESTVQQILETIYMAHNLRVEGLVVFSRIDVLISADKRYGDTDCGSTARRLRDELGEFHPRAAEVYEVRYGDIFCGLLNYGVAKQMRDHIDYSMILSTGVKDYLTAENMQAMLLALEVGAKVTGLAITELAPSILDGRIANTCAIWHNESLMTVGGFDLMARKPKIGEDKKNAGVEEIPPLLRMTELFGPCIAPVVPSTGAKWVIPDNPDVRSREEKKLASKLERQQMHATALGYPDVVEALKAGVMSGYGWRAKD